MNKNYYKAYEKRYAQIYENNMLWSSNEPTPDVSDFLDIFNVSKTDKILEIGCGEGRDAIYLLNKGYNLLALDYSNSVIEKCNQLSNNKYTSKFKQFDLICNKLGEKFNYIYSVAVLHMFVLEEHRNIFWTFVKEHLTNNGRCLICILGDGEREYKTNINDAFKNVMRTIMNNNKEVSLATTSCCIVNWITLEEEIKRNGLEIEKQWISNKIPEFSKCMCVIVKGKDKDEEETINS